MIPVGAFDGGDQPSVPGTPTATTGQNTTSTITFAPSAYIGKGTVSYEVVSSPGGLIRGGSSPLEFTGLTNGVTYTFTVRAKTDYGVYSDATAASNAITPVTPIPPNPCAGCPSAGTFLGSVCSGAGLYYQYADGCCGVGSTVLVDGNSSSCPGYVPPQPPPPGCDTCVYTVTGQSTIPCGCAEIRFMYKQKVYVRTTYTYRCTPDGCVGCSCPTENIGPCTQTNLECYAF